MNMSTLCTIKYMNRSYLSKARYMIGVGFKILGRTPVPKLPPIYPPPPPPPRPNLALRCYSESKSVSLSSSSGCVQILLTVGSIGYLNAKAFSLY